MNYDVDVALGEISSGVSRIEGLYAKFSQKYGVQYGTAQVLYVIGLKAPLTQKQISETCEIPKQTINGVVKQLLADKHITLSVNSENKREKIINLTPSGEAYTQRLLMPLIELNQKVGERIGIDSIRQISKSIALLGDALEMEIELKEVSSKWEDKVQKNILKGE